MWVLSPAGTMYRMLVTDGIDAFRHNVCSVPTHATIRAHEMTMDAVAVKQFGRFISDEYEEDTEAFEEEA
jgi:hypothetical protein